MKLEIGRTIRLIENKENGIEIIGKFIEGFKLIKGYQKESRECFIYKSTKCEEEYLAELFFNENIHRGYIRIGKIKKEKGLN